MLVLTFLSYKVCPPKIIKAKLCLFIIVMLFTPMLITKTSSHYTIVKYTELGDKEHKDSSYNQLIISIAFPPDSMYLTIYFLFNVV
jgi:hypothetical protein